MRAVTDESRPLLGPAEITKMKRGAYLINTARAALVDQTALVAALKDGHLAGAAVDVFAVEPPGSDHPLLQLGNVIATPHVGGNTFEVSSHQGAIVAANLAELLRGERPHNMVNPETLEHFSWTAPRPVPCAEVLEQLRQNSRPALTDLPLESDSVSSAPQTAVLPIETPGATKKEGLLSGLKEVFFGHRSGSLGVNTSAAEPRNSNADPTPNGPALSDKVRARMEQLLVIFTQRLNHDAKILSFAEGRQVTVRYELNDVKLSFYMSFDRGAVRCAVGEPPQKPEVTLKMKADILDKLFTGRENGAKAAMSGKLSFIGDTIKAMSLQRLQKDFNRLYTEARAQVGDLDALFAGAATESPSQSSRLELLSPLRAKTPARRESPSVIFATRSFTPSRKCTPRGSSPRRAAT